MGIRVALATAVATLLAAIVATAGAAPAVERGIALAVAAPSALEGPGGGVVTVEIHPRPSGDVAFVTTARRPDGRLLWRRARTVDCGSGGCHGNGERPQRHPDGTIGPVGFTGGEAWAYDEAGREVGWCPGARDARGGCIHGIGLDEPGEPLPRAAVVGHDGAGERWRTVLPGVRWHWDAFARVEVARDHAGRAYAVFPGLVADGPTAVAVRRVHAVSAVDGRALWHADGPMGILAALGRGVLVGEQRAIAAHGPDGALLWRRPASGPPLAWRAAVDTRRGRVVVSGVAARPRAIALRVEDGRPLWGTRPRDAAHLLGVDRAGRTYVAATAGPGRGVVALAPGGGQLWRLPLRGRVLAAVPMAGGRVAVVVTPPRAARARLLVVRG